MNQLQTFENELFKVSARLEDGQALFDVEKVARSLGFTTVAKSGNETVRWNRVNSYLPANSPQVAKGDFIPEPLVYKLAFKASNKLAEKFQDWLAIEVIPSIRKTGSYEMKQPQSQLEILQGTINQLVQQDKRVAKLEGEVSNIASIISLSSNEWREKCISILRKIAQRWTGVEPYRSVTNLSYERLEKRANCSLNIRLNNRKKNAISNGMGKTQVKNIKKIDLIAEDKRLTEIYLQVIKEMAIQFKIDINDFKHDLEVM
jgi:prophage antirepressor-like protein